ncbi:MAG: carboxymuconolactone decarboxylase family protein [Planctomycetia bacterium]|nr:carboxymuconolactone decarboxylase family protein [Planctomycetia bacterium]
MYDPANLKKMKTMKELAPEPMAAFHALNDAVFKEGALSVKVKELIAVAVAVTTQCPYCIDVHVKKAKAAGATEAELTEATLVAAALKAGGAVTHGTHAIG